MIISEDLSRLERMLDSKQASNVEQCHKFCFKHLADKLSKKHDSSYFFKYICNFWKLRKKPIDILVEKAFLNFLVNLEKLDEKVIQRNSDHLSLISQHIFSITYNSLSLKCLKIKAMCRVIVWEMATQISSSTIVQHIQLWMNELNDSLFITRAPEPQRLSSADSIRDTGAKILDWMRRLFLQNEVFGYGFAFLNVLFVSCGSTLSTNYNFEFIFPSIPHCFTHTDDSI